MSTRIIIPVRHEAENIVRLVGEIGEYVPEAEIFFVDDSDTSETVMAIKLAQMVHPGQLVSYLHREGTQRTGGIVGAVTDGMALAVLDGITQVVIMDGDGQHDPACLEAIIRNLAHSDIVPGSRNIKGGTRDGLDGPIRQFLSWGATRAAKTLFPRLLIDVSDPMSGIFGINLSKIDLTSIRANGFKVLLEIMLTHQGLSVFEVPVRFRSRFDGESKADLSVGRDFAVQLVQRRREIPVGVLARERYQLENV